MWKTTRATHFEADQRRTCSQGDDAERVGVPENKEPSIRTTHFEADQRRTCSSTMRSRMSRLSDSTWRNEMVCLEMRAGRATRSISRRAKGEPHLALSRAAKPAALVVLGLVCLEMRGPPLVRRISRVAENAP